MIADFSGHAKNYIEGTARLGRGYKQQRASGKRYGPQTEAVYRGVM